MSKVKIVCPNPAMIPIAVEGSIPLEKMYENLWIVDEQAYETCVIETTKPQNRVLMKCDSPLQLRYFTVVFQRYSAVGADGLEFEPGKEYYFIATSNGHGWSLEQTSGGRCATHNMRMKVYVCTDENDPKCQTSPVSTAQSTKTITVCPSPTQFVQVSSTISHLPPHQCIDNNQLNKILNNTRFVPAIFDQTNHLAKLWAQVMNMSEQLTAVQNRLENCSFGGGYGHVIVPSASSTSAPIQTSSPTPTQQVTYSNCTALYNAGFKVSGIYTINPEDGMGSFPVYCDQTTAEGGWTVLQKRFDGSVWFSNRTWVEYKNGFGNVSGEFWLGLDRIHRLAKNPVTLRFDLGAPDGTNRFAVYKGFTVAGADQKFLMTSGTYTDGDAGDSFSFESGNKFSTPDQDNDKYGAGHCAKLFKSGWWHGVCHKASLNGLYLNGSDKDPAHFASGITWHTWKGYDYFLTKSEMKIRP